MFIAVLAPKLPRGPLNQSAGFSFGLQSANGTPTQKDTAKEMRRVAADMRGIAKTTRKLAANKRRKLKKRMAFLDALSQSPRDLNL
jgi:hypothetical protein